MGSIFSKVLLYNHTRFCFTTEGEDNFVSQLNGDSSRPILDQLSYLC